MTNKMEADRKIGGVLKALLQGRQIKIGERTWTLGECEDGSTDLCQVARSAARTSQNL